MNIKHILSNLFGQEQDQADPDEILVPSQFSEGTINIPEKAIEIIQHVPKIELGIGAISQCEVKDGIGSITALGVYGAFEELEELLRRLEIPFVRTAMREMIQHQINVYVPASDGSREIDVEMPCDENGEPFITVNALGIMLKAFGPDGMANKIREYDARRKVHLADWNKRINVAEKIGMLGDIYITVRAFQDAKRTHPNSSDELCQAFANSMAHLTDPTFNVGLGFDGPSAREYYFLDMAKENSWPLGEMDYDEARELLLSGTGPIFGPLNVIISNYIIELKTSNDAPEDLSLIKRKMKGRVH